jgi:hypothetical protein
MPAPCWNWATDAAACWSKPAPKRRRWLLKVRMPSMRGAGRHRTGEPLHFTTDPASPAPRCGTCARASSRPVGAVRRTGTTVIIEDVAFPGRTPGRGHAGPAAPAREFTATPRPSSTATRWKATCTSSSRRTSADGRGRALPPLHGRGVPDGGAEVRRLAEGRTRHRPQHGALRRDGMGQAAYA